MKSTFFILLFTSLLSFGQNGNSNLDEILFERTDAIVSLSGELCLGCRGLKEKLTKEDSLRIEFGNKIDDQISELALENYTKLIDSFPNSKFLYKALKQKAEIEYYLGKYTQAKKSFSRILQSTELNSNKEYFYNANEAEYKNNSALKLARISIKENDFLQAIKYLEESKSYKVKYMCGLSYTEKRAELNKLYLVCEEGLKKSKK